MRYSFNLKMCFGYLTYLGLTYLGQINTSQTPQVKLVKRVCGSI